MRSIRCFDSAEATAHQAGDRSTGRHRGTGAGIAAILGLAAVVLAVPAAQAATPTTKPVQSSTSVLAAKHACAFKVIDRTLTTGKRAERIFRHGRHVISGPAREKLTNADSRATIVVNGSGTISYRKGADGRTRYRFSGPNVLYFYPGDQGSFGEVGENGALYHLVGKVGETLDKNDVVIAFAFRGRVTELCSKIL